MLSWLTSLLLVSNLSFLIHWFIDPPATLTYFWATPAFTLNKCWHFFDDSLSISQAPSVLILSQVLSGLASSLPGVPGSHSYISHSCSQSHSCSKPRVPVYFPLIYIRSLSLVLALSLYADSHSPDQERLDPLQGNSPAKTKQILTTFPPHTLKSFIIMNNT